VELVEESSEVVITLFKELQHLEQQIGVVAQRWELLQ
jgi:hypothetical protein